MENELGMCGFALFISSKGRRTGVKAKKIFKDCFRGVKVVVVVVVRIFFNYLFLSTSSLCFPNSSLNKTDWRNCY